MGKEKYIKILAWSRKKSKRVKVVREEVVNGRGSCSWLVFYRLREMGHVRWPAGEGERCKEPATRGEWVVGGCHTRKSWPASLFSLQFVQPPARPADVAFADIRGHLFYLISFHLFYFILRRSLGAELATVLGRAQWSSALTWPNVGPPTAGHRPSPRLQLVLVRSTLLLLQSMYLSFSFSSSSPSPLFSQCSS